MNEHKKDLSCLSVAQLLAWRRELREGIGDLEHVLAGSLVEQTRRCGRAGCRCVDGKPHGPYAYFAAREHGRGRLRYVPSSLVEAVRGYVLRGERVAVVLAEISQINVELLARRELG
jgi:hypothetical protein